MASEAFRFENFRLHPEERRLTRDGRPVELNGRYLDALTLLVRQQGCLVSKDQFHEEVWRGVPVTDEALTQCIRSLRRQLGDSAVTPRFIETVPKHGYRFIAPVETGEDPEAPATPTTTAHGPAMLRQDWQQLLLLGGAGTAGAAAAGLLGGLFYGFAGTSQPLQPGMGTMSVLLVLLCVTSVVATVGGAGVSFGIASAQRLSNGKWGWTSAGGAAGGFIIGTAVKLLGLDAFTLLLGKAPAGITGGVEGLFLGGAVGASYAVARQLSADAHRTRGLPLATAIGAATGLLIPLFGGHLMGGSLDLLAQTFPGSRLSLDPIGPWMGESRFGPASQAATGCLEGALFTACIVWAMLLVHGRKKAKTALR